MASQQSVTCIENNFLHLIDLNKVKGKEALQISINSLTNDSSIASDVFNAWCTKLLAFYGTEVFQYKELKSIFALHNCFVNELINSLINKDQLDHNDDHNLTCMIKTLQDWQNLLKCLKDILKDLSLVELGIVLQTALDILKKYNIFLLKSSRLKSNGKEKQFLREIQKESQVFLNDVLTLVGESPSMFICKSNVCMETIVIIILSLCTVGELVSLIDIKSTAQTWKCVAALSTDNSEFLKKNYAFNTGTNWLCRPINYLCQKVERTIQTIYQKSEQNQQIEPIERNLKMTSFYLKLLIKIASNYEHTFFPSCKEVINFMLIALIPPNHIVGSNIESLLNQYLLDGFSNLLQCIYKNPDVRHLINEKIGSETEYLGAFIVTFEVLKLLISEIDEDGINKFVFSTDSNIFENIFKRILTIDDRSSVIFDNIVEISSAFFFTNLKNEKIVNHLERLFVNGVLQTNRFLANICISIWLQIARFSEVNRYGFLKFWWECRQLYSFPNNESVPMQIDILIQSLYDILTSSMKQDFWGHLSETHKLNGIIVLGIDRYPDPMETKLLCNKLSIQLYQLLHTSDEPLNIEGYTKIIANLGILATIKMENKNNLCNLVGMFLIASIKEIAEDESLYLLLDQLYRFVSNKKHEIEPDTITNLLRAVEQKISVIKNDKFKTLYQNLVKLSTDWVGFENDIKDCDIKRTNVDPENSNIKRIKIEPNVPELLANLSRNVQDIKQYTNSNRLNSNEQLLIKGIINDLNKIIFNKQ